jgi:hypothetical protein
MRPSVDAASAARPQTTLSFASTVQSVQCAWQAMAAASGCGRPQAHARSARDALSALRTSISTHHQQPRPTAERIKKSRRSKPSISQHHRGRGQSATSAWDSADSRDPAGIRRHVPLCVGRGGKLSGSLAHRSTAAPAATNDGRTEGVDCL